MILGQTYPIMINDAYDKKAFHKLAASLCEKSAEALRSWIQKRRKNQFRLAPNWKTGNREEGITIRNANFQ